MFLLHSIVNFCPTNSVDYRSATQKKQKLNAYSFSILNNFYIEYTCILV